MMKYLYIIIFSLFSVVLFGQKEIQKSNINGSVYDVENQAPLQYITISLQDISTEKLYTVLTDEQGKFMLNVPLGTYYFSASSTSFKAHTINVLKIQQDLELGVIELIQNVEELNEIEVLAKNNLVDYKFNKKIYNASKDLANTGGNAITVLENTPSVKINEEGQISLRGSSAQVLVNGKPYGGQQSNADILSLIPANSINKIEIITRSAKYSAEGGGGIINIVLKKGSNDGLNGTIEAHLGVPENHGASGFLNYKTKNYNLFSTASFNHKIRIKNTNIEQIFLDENNIPYGNFDEKRTDNRESNNILLNLGSDFYLSDKTTLTGSVLYSSAHKDYNSDLYLNDYNPVDVLERSSLREVYDDTRENYLETFVNLQTNLAKEGQQLSARINFDRNTSKNDTFTLNNETYPGSSTGSQNFFFDQFLNSLYFQIDYEHPFDNEALLEVGSKSSFRVYQNDYEVEGYNALTQQFELFPTFSNIVDYEENIYALYANYGKEYEKFRYSIGLRAEISRTDIRETNENKSIQNNYNDLFPNASISYTFENMSSLSMSYSRSIDRPTVKQLNPFSSFTDERFHLVGNPYLEPYRSDFFMLEYHKDLEKLSLNVVLYYLKSKDKTMYIVEKLDSQTSEGFDIFKRYPVNNGTYSYSALEFEFNYSPSKKFRFYGMINPYYAVLSDTESNIYDYEDWILYTSLRGLYKITDTFRLQLSYVYQSPQRTAITKLDKFQYMTLALSKDLFKNKATITFNINDLFNSKKGIYNTLEANTISYIDFRYDTQYLLTFVYRFNNSKTRNVKNRTKDTHKNVFEVDYELN